MSPEDASRQWVALMVRRFMVAVYVLIGWLSFLGGITATEFGVLLVVGAIFFVLIVTSDWIAAGVQRVPAQHFPNCAVTDGKRCDCGLE